MITCFEKTLCSVPQEGNKVYVISFVLFNKYFNVDIYRLCLILVLLLLLLLLNVNAFAIS